MDRFQQLRAFVAVVEAGSFVGAANALELSTAAISRHISALESRLDVRLLYRTTRRLSLTHEGELFQARAQAVLDGLEEAEAEISARSGSAIGELRINAPVSFGIRHLATLWGAFSAAHPAVRLDLTLSDRLVDLVEEGFDVAIRIARLPDSTLISRRLADTRMALCAAPAYVERQGAPGTPADLANHVIWAYRYFADGDTWRFDGRDGEVSVRVDPVLRTNNGDTCRAGALAGHCVVLQPTFLVGEDLRAGRLVELLPDYEAATLGIYALYPSRRHVVPRVRLLVDYLVEAFANSEWTA